MEPGSWVALATALVTAIAVHLKNRSQDARVEELERDFSFLSAKFSECEEERRFLWDWAESFDEKLRHK